MVWLKVVLYHSESLFSSLPLPVLYLSFFVVESAKLAAADLHKASSLSFSLYKKRPALKVKVKRSVNANAAALLAGYQFDHSDLHVKEVARELVKNIPSYEGVIEVGKKCLACFVSYELFFFFFSLMRSKSFFSITSFFTYPLFC